MHTRIRLNPTDTRAIAIARFVRTRETTLCERSGALGPVPTNSPVREKERKKERTRATRSSAHRHKAPMITGPRIWFDQRNFLDRRIYPREQFTRAYMPIPSTVPTVSRAGRSKASRWQSEICSKQHIFLGCERKVISVPEECIDNK